MNEIRLIVTVSFAYKFHTQKSNNYDAIEIVEKYFNF